VTDIFGTINNVLGQAQDFGQSPLGQLVVGGLGGYFQNRAIGDALDAQGNFTNQAISGINNAFNQFSAQAEPFRQAGIAALPGITASAYSPFRFSDFVGSPEFNQIGSMFGAERDLMNRGRGTMVDMMNNNGLWEPADFVTGNVPDLNTRAPGALPGFNNQSVSPINLTNQGMIDPLNFEGEPYQAMMDEGIRAIQDANILEGRGASGNTMRDLYRFGSSLKQNQINTAMGLRDQQFGERALMSGQNFGQDLARGNFNLFNQNQNFNQMFAGEDQRWNQGLANRMLRRGEELDVWDRVAAFRNQQMGERGQLFNQGLAMNNCPARS
jgi:hypothetical protein